MPTAARPHCILRARDSEILALVFGLCRWSANCGRLLAVYYSSFLQTLIGEALLFFPQGL
jgi:hypothetical protein